MIFKLVEDNSKKFKLYTNGIKTIRVYDGDEIPDGFYRGQHHSHTAWNKGLSVESDERVRDNVDRAHATRNQNYHPAWNKGLTKEIDDRIKSNAGEKNPMYGKHPKAWNKGLTADTHPAMKRASENHKGAIPWNKGISTGYHWTADMFQKRYETQMKNGTLGKNIDTKAEKEFYQHLLQTYDPSEIIHPYMDKQRYPYRCDFYIIPEDKFIEIHGNWTHGGRPFDPNDAECVKQLKIWEEKAKTSEYYKNAIYTWTDFDVRKAETANKNNLNFEVIYYKY